MDMETTKQELAKALIDRAEKGEHTPKETLTNINAYRAAKTCRTAVEKVVYSMNKSASATLKVYLESIDTGAALEQLLAYKALRGVEKFYIDEFNILQEMIEDYEKYMFSNPFNMVSALMGDERDAG